MLSPLLTLLLVISGQVQDLRPIYDARRSPEPAKFPTAEIASLKRNVQPAAKRFWDKRADQCDEELEVIDAAQGSFTKPKSNQKAILYRYCTTGHNFALNGIAVIEDGQLAAHYVYDGAWDNAIGALSDIDGNGLSEILIATGGTNQGITWGVISIIELSEKGARKFGATDTYSDNCVAQEKGKASAYKLYVKTGSAPAFQRETFISSACGVKGSWLKSGAQKQIAMREDEIEYHRLK